MRRVSIALIVALSGPAMAQTPQPAPPPVESLTCEQMYAEMMVAGQRMSGQLDPRLGAMAQEQMRKMNDPAAYASASGALAAESAACSNPLTIVSCRAMQQARAAEAQTQVAENHARTAQMQAMMQNATVGIDMPRMQALQTRIEKLKCPQPQAPG